MYLSKACCSAAAEPGNSCATVCALQHQLTNGSPHAALPSLLGIQAFFNAVQEVKVTLEPKLTGPIGAVDPACVASVPPALALPVVLAVAAGSGVGVGVGVALAPTQVLDAAATAVVPPLVPATAPVPLVVAAIGTASPVVVVLAGSAKLSVV